MIDEETHFTGSLSIECLKLRRFVWSDASFSIDLQNTECNCNTNDYQHEHGSNKKHQPKQVAQYRGQEVVISEKK